MTGCCIVAGYFFCLGFDFVGFSTGGLDVIVSDLQDYAGVGIGGFWHPALNAFKQSSTDQESGRPSR